MKNFNRLILTILGIFFSLTSYLCLPLEERLIDTFENKPSNSLSTLVTATGVTPTKNNNNQPSSDVVTALPQHCRDRGKSTRARTCNKKDTLIREPNSSRVPQPVTRDYKAFKDPEIDLKSMFIEESDDYPEDEIRRLLKHTSEHVKSLFNVLNTPLDPNGNLTERIAHHFVNEEAELPKEESVCQSVIRNIYPRKAARFNSLVYVPNNQEFMQVIQAEICQYPEQDCSYLQDSLPYGLTSACVQKYSYKKLLFVDPLEKRMSSDLFRYPSCCTCYIRSLPLDLRTNLKSESSSTPNYFNLSHPLNLSTNQTSILYSSNDTLILVTEGGFTSTNQGTEKTDDSVTATRYQPNIEIGAEDVLLQKASTSFSGSTSMRTDTNRLYKQLGSTTTTAKPLMGYQAEVTLSSSTVVLHNDKVYKPSNIET